jgi:lysophospholipase L1-like esterase
MWSTRGLVRIGTEIGSHAENFNRAEGGMSVLVFGDSTAVGQGVSDPVFSVAGRVSAWLNASVENYAKSGAVTHDVLDQIAKAQKDRYDLVLIQIGANDVIRFRSLSDAQADLKRILQEATRLSDRVVLLTAGKIGTAPFFPIITGPLLTHRAAQLRDRFKPTVEGFGAVYVDLFTAADPFASDPKRYYSPDGLHLSDDGYGFWFDQVQQAVIKKWPEFSK